MRKSLRRFREVLSDLLGKNRVLTICLIKHLAFHFVIAARLLKGVCH